MEKLECELGTIQKLLTDAIELLRFNKNLKHAQRNEKHKEYKAKCEILTLKFAEDKLEVENKYSHMSDDDAMRDMIARYKYTMKTEDCTKLSQTCQSSINLLEYTRDYILPSERTRDERQDEKLREKIDKYKEELCQCKEGIRMHTLRKERRNNGHWC